MNLCVRWLEGQRDVLWNHAQAPRRSKRTNHTEGGLPSEVKERVAELVAQGQLSKACATLSRKPPVAVTTEVIKEMKRNHPLQRAPINWDSLRSIHGSGTEDVSEETVEKMVASVGKVQLAVLLASSRSTRKMFLNTLTVTKDSQVRCCRQQAR